MQYSLLLRHAPDFVSDSFRASKIDGPHLSMGSLKADAALPCRRSAAVSRCGSSSEDLPLRSAIAADIDTLASVHNTDQPRSKMRQFLAAQAECWARI